MTDRGLNSRLRQRSRRAGVMIGVSIAMTIAICVAGFSVIYAALDEFTADFVSDGDPTVEVTPENEVAGPEPTTELTAEQSTEGEQSEGETQEPTVAPTGEATSGDNQAQPTEPSDEFTPDYQISAGESINFRSGPGTNSEVVTTLTSEQALQYLGESQPSDDPERDGLGEDQVWMKFRTEDGEEGWVRELDVEPYDPDA
jgi:hypothetical protein